MEKDDKLIFQVLDWDFFHEDDDDGNKQFAIRLFGKDKQQRSVYVQVDDFKPYFYVELEDHWKYTTVDSIITEVKKRVPKDKVNGLIKFSVEEKYKFWGFTNYKKFKFAKFTFNDFDSMKSYSFAFGNKPYKIFSVSKKWLKFKLYESNILPVLRFMHIRQLEAFGWVSIDKKDLDDFNNPPTCNEINYKTKWQCVNKVDDRLIEKFSIASFDIECTSGDGTFPQPNRPEDKVIQIGITTSRYGESECYSQHLLSLNKTSDIPGATVEWFSCEEDLLMGFTKYMRKANPDIITGYNIFGFDFKYLYERSKFLGIEHKFARLSRVTGENSEWIEQNLSSAALGTNILTYYKMTGRVIVDLMKVVQRDHKLSSYKLDYVASYFIREKITKFTEDKKNKTFRIDTKNTFGLYKDRFITVTYAEGPVESKYNDGEKFRVVDLGKDFVILEGSIDTSEFLNKGYDVYWCQAKDDISPNQIFSKFEGSADDRAEVGKYCLQDCMLCNKLIDKLQIITNNVGMANVCNVPLSYLFLRGQGVKIFSLVAKKCREREHLIPVIKKKVKKEDKTKPVDPNAPIDPIKAFKEKQDMIMEKFINALNNKHKEEESTEDDEDVGYEGAIVFPPRPGVYFEPVTVLDYASLYPSSMILRNLSHEMFVNDPRYDNLPGYRYHTISYKVMTREDLEEKAKENIRAKSKSKKPKSNMVARQFDEVSRENLLEGIDGGCNNDDDCQMITCRFAEKLDGSKGIIPEILQDLLSARKKFKKMQEAEKDPFTKGIYESLQLAYKVTANSLYGQTGASTSPVCMKEIAASTTATGREMLQFSKYFIEFIYAKVINLALDDKEKYAKEMEKIFKYYPNEIEYPDTNRETEVVTNVKLHVATDVNRELPPSKFIRQAIGYEVDMEFDKEFTLFFDNMKKKYLDVYNSIFTEVLEKGKPTGMITFGSTNKDDKKDNNIVYQMFCLKVDERDAFLKDIEKYVINGKGTTSTLFTKYETFWKNIMIPDDSTLKKAFLKPLQELDADKKAIFMTNLEVLIDETGYNGKDEMIAKFYKFINKTMEGYHVVNQEVIYGDTDSVFYCPHFVDDKTKIKLKDKKSLIMAIFTGVWASILIGTLLPAPMAQEFEKVMFPLILQGKKRYVGNLYEKDPNKYKQKIMGIELRRRDNAPIVKMVLAGLVHEILNNRSAEGAYEFARDALNKIITGKFKMDKFIITKTLKGNALTKSERKTEALKPKESRSYANRSQIVHAVLADRMADRDPGNRPLSNDRIPYIYVEPKGAVKLQGDRVETPEYIIENKLKIDYLFYITNQIKKPALKFLDLMIENAEKLFTEFEIKEKNRKDCVMPINFYFERDAEEVEREEQEYYGNYDHDSGSENDEAPKKKNKPKRIVQDLVYFDDMMAIKHESSDDEAPKKKKKNTKNTKVLVEDKPKKKKMLSSDLTYGDLLNGMDDVDNLSVNEPIKKSSKVKKSIKQDSPKKEQKKKNSPSITTSKELLADFFD